MSVCFSCGGELPAEKAFRTSVCPICGKGIRACLNCKFYLPGAHWDCRETVSEPVRDKEIPNFCDYFVLNEKNAFDQENPKQEDDSKSAFNDLFND